MFLQNELKKSKESIDQKKSTIAEIISNELATISKSIKTSEGTLWSDPLLIEDSPPEKNEKQLSHQDLVANSLKRLNGTITQLYQHNDSLERVQRLMGEAPSSNKELEDFKKKFDGRNDLWNSFFNFNK